MIDMQSPRIQAILAAIGGIETERGAFGRQMSAISAATGIHLAQVMRAIGAGDYPAAIEEAAEILKRQVVAIANAQYKLDGLDSGRPQ